MKLKISGSGFRDLDNPNINWYSNENSEVKQWLSEGNIPEPEFTDEELVKQKQDEFRAKRNILLDKVDKDINKAEDLGKDSTVLRTYRQALRDATVTWTMPEGVL